MELLIEHYICEIQHIKWPREGRIEGEETTPAWARLEVICKVLGDEEYRKALSEILESMEQEFLRPWQHLGSKIPDQD